MHRRVLSIYLTQGCRVDRGITNEAHKRARESGTPYSWEDQGEDGTNQGHSTEDPGTYVQRASESSCWWVQLNVWWYYGSDTTFM